MNTQVDESLAHQLQTSRKVTEAFSSHLNARKEQELREEDLDVKIATMVLQTVAKIPKPVNGKNGSDGSDGIDGINGVNGLNGKTGKTGKTGPMGEMGPMGLKGEKGDKGLIGLTGAKGDTGETGPAGKDSIDGLDGEQGPAGENGKDGVDGQDGLDGADGKDGKDGVDGGTLLNVKSSPTSYIFTMDNGKTFDVDFPAMRAAGVGKDGVDGKNGTNGTNGKNGKAGAQGIQGKPGKTGAQGKRGEHGVGIEDISTEDAELKIKLTNGSVKKVKLPGGNVAPIAPMTVQRAKRTPLDGAKVGLSATNVEDGFSETLGRIQQAASGNPFGANTAASFMFDFNVINDTHSSNFVYNGSNQLINTFVVDPVGTVLYSIAFTYFGKELESKVITNVSAGDSVDTSFTYTGSQLTSKVLTYVPA